MAKTELQRFDVVCTRCGHTWLTKPCPREELPGRCPKCKSAYWNRPRPGDAAMSDPGTPTFACARCRDARFVCERHVLSPWPHGDCDYPGMPCPVCQPPGTKPELGSGWQSIAKVDDDT